MRILEILNFDVVFVPNNLKISRFMIRDVENVQTRRLNYAAEKYKIMGPNIQNYALKKINKIKKIKNTCLKKPELRLLHYFIIYYIFVITL